MTCEFLLQKALCQLSSNNIVKAALMYFKATEGLLFCQYRHNEISEEDYQFRTNEIKYFRNTIENTINAGPLKIVKIIEIEANPSMIIDAKSTFEILKIPEILVEIASNLFPEEKDIEMFAKELKQIEEDNLAYR
ncbi:hypothetical protein C2G38_2235169 [Gigaspora rosea]|uniref:Uncharacterized protein n=1 Tax=Gigaspora rosea TaxID=44941 RepID=A0A397TU46_9GLOM|nr:hypothetical protein C2G38_2235169 [Gigaspora rosea]